MKKFWIALVIVLVLNGVAYFMLVPKITSQSYSEGYQKGMLEGTVIGDAQGRAVQKRHDDSIGVAAAKKKEVVPVKVRRKAPKVQTNPYDINYDMYGNQVGDVRK